MWIRTGRESVVAALVVVTLMTLMRTCSASYGDMSHPFQQCLQVCRPSRCNNPASNIRFYENRPLHLRLLGWDCDSECKYDCMWEAVEIFRKNDLDIPQFSGKWPFVRWMGMQEPASAIASVLNGVAAYYYIRRYNRRFPPSTPFFHLWRFYYGVVCNAWFWSFVFHVRDTEWTEKLDYFSAFSLILVQLYSCLVRIVGTSPVRKPLVLGLVLGLIYLHHCVSMSLVHFDYGYNMKVNLFFAGINVITWVSFCGFMISKGYKHFWWGFAAISWFAASGLLETLEFTPLLWTFDSHSLFHFFTIPIPFFTYEFIIRDSYDLLRGDERAAKTSYQFELNIDEPSGGGGGGGGGGGYSLPINDFNFNNEEDRRKAE